MRDMDKIKEQHVAERHVADLRISEARHKRKERGLQEALKYAEAIFETIRESLLVLDLDLRITKANRCFYDSFKVTPQETIGSLVYDVGNRQWDIPRLRTLLEDILPKEDTLDGYEVEHDFAAIGRRTMVLNARRIDGPTGKGQTILLAIEDISEKRKLDVEATKARDVIEAANRELEAFAYSVSHDLRSPLRTIDGFSQALLEDCKEQLDDTAKSYLHRVREAAQHMGRLIDDMLKLSRVTRSKFNCEPVNLSNMIEAVSDRLQSNGAHRTVDMIIEKEVFVNGDPDLILIAIENLMENAWKFTAGKAQPRVEFGTMVTEGATACFIRDNGAGFDMAYVDKLFSAFERLHSSSEFAGTGIGLATVQRIVNRHGGRVWAEAEVEKGATFFFIL
jgi:signal transduction histidine kinase